MTSETRPSLKTLHKTVKKWLGGFTMFLGTEYSSRTYEDFVEYIGCPAQEFVDDSENGKRIYTWIAAEHEDSKLQITFINFFGEWKLAYLGSVLFSLGEEVED